MNDPFSELFLHPKTKKILEKTLDSIDSSHAILFCGSAHLGKTTTAYNIAKHLLKSEPSRHPDFFEIDLLYNEKTKKQAHQISVDQIRELQQRFFSTSFSGGKKIAIIQKIESFSKNAANAFLKLLEEPKGDTLFILTTNHLNDVLKTIQSRTMIIRFFQPDENFLQTFLEKKSSHNVQELIHSSCSLIGRCVDSIGDKKIFEKRISLYRNIESLFEISLFEQLKFAQQLSKKSQTEQKEIDEFFEMLIYVAKQKLLTQSSTKKGRYSDKSMIEFLKRCLDAKKTLSHYIQPSFVFEHITLSLHL